MRYVMVAENTSTKIIQVELPTPGKNYYQTASPHFIDQHELLNTNSYGFSSLEEAKADALENVQNHGTLERPLFWAQLVDN